MHCKLKALKWVKRLQRFQWFQWFVSHNNEWNGTNSLIVAIVCGLSLAALSVTLSRFQPKLIFICDFKMSENFGVNTNLLSNCCESRSFMATDCLPLLPIGRPLPLRHSSAICYAKAVPSHNLSPICVRRKSWANVLVPIVLFNECSQWTQTQRAFHCRGFYSVHFRE